MTRRTGPVPISPSKVLQTATLSRLRYIALGALLTSIGFQALAGGEAPAEVKAKEQKLIAILRSDAAPAEKAITCKRLAIYGSAEAVPALAPLLSDPHLASWARIALEAIPGPAPDTALRQAAGHLQGELLVGVLNSIGVRRDPKAVGLLVKDLNATAPEVAAAAADALGRIGGSGATRALTRALRNGREDTRSAVAEGCIRCAERYLAEKKAAAARRIYDQVRRAAVPEERLLEATRGAILARGPGGVPLLLEQLRASDKRLFNLGLTTARELPGPEATAALAKELEHCEPSRRTRLLLALADRDDPLAWPSILHALRAGSTELRLTAIGVVERSGNPQSLQVLLETATDPTRPISRAALASLTRLPGNNINPEIIARLRTDEGKTRPVLLKLAGARHIDAALPTLARAMQDADPASRAAAIQAVGQLGGPPELERLVTLVSAAQDQDQRDEIESALLAISAREGTAGVQALLPLMRNPDASMRTLGLHALASAGGPRALAALSAAVDDTDEAVQQEAVRTLASWPNTWPEDAAAAEELLKLARSGRKESYQVLGLRGYLQFLEADKQLKPAKKVEKLQQVLPLLKRAEEKQQALAVLRSAPTSEGLELLSNFVDDPAVAEDACAAALEAASHRGLNKDLRRKLLQQVLDKSTNPATRQRAEAALKAL